MNFLRTQFRETSLYLMLIDQSSQNTRLDWNDDLTARCPEGTLLLATVVADASPQGWGATLELDSGEVLVAHGAWLNYKILWTSNWKELQTIYLGIIAFTGVCKELQITNLLIRSNNSTAVFDLRKLRTTDTLAPAVKEIYLTCQHLNIKIIIQHVRGKINIIADALSRLFRSGDNHIQTFYLDQIRKILKIQLTLDLFALSTTKLLPRSVTANIMDQQVQ
ncbi:MAG: hypothetical protein EZS28_048549, partial [Streblomastix strix]